MKGKLLAIGITAFFLSGINVGATGSMTSKVSLTVTGSILDVSSEILSEVELPKEYEQVPKTRYVAFIPEGVTGDGGIFENSNLEMLGCSVEASIDGNFEVDYGDGKLQSVKPDIELLYEGTFLEIDGNKQQLGNYEVRGLEVQIPDNSLGEKAQKVSGTVLYTFSFVPDANQE